MIPLFDLQAQYQSIKSEIDAAVNRVLSSGHYIGGDEIALFEKELADKLHVKHAVSCASGTDALILSLRAAGIGPGDEVIVPAFSFWATASAVLHVGATPVFVDISPDTGNIDTNLIDEHITSRTAAILLVHLYGHPADMDAIWNIALERSLIVIEDAAQACGALDLNLNKYTGAISDLGCLSFFPTKPLGCAGDGGAVLTNNDAYADRLRMLKSHGWKQKYYPEILGYNSRLDAIQAAILRVKLRHFEAWIEARQRIAALYNNAFLGQVHFLRQPKWGESVYHLYIIIVNERDRIQDELKAKGIETGVYYPEILPFCKPIQEVHIPGQYPDAAWARDHFLAIPCYAEMTDTQVTQVIEAVLEAVHEP